MNRVVKRNGQVVDFKPEKIYRALEKALKASGEDVALAKPIGDNVIVELLRRYPDKDPTVEEVQDCVEHTLVAEGMYHPAKAYILYRQTRQEVRSDKEVLGVRDALKLSLNALKVLRDRYLKKNVQGEIVESPDGMFRRVAKALAEVDKDYKGNPGKSEEDFYNIMARLEFLPNSPALMNAGTDLGQLSACFVIPIEDSLISIFNAMKYAALIHQSGGGTGFSFSRIRPKGDIVKSTMGVASGPVSFLRIFDRATEIIKQGGRRRGANMGVLSVHHPDIVEFITVKEREGELTNFNISVGLSDDFIVRVRENKHYELKNPRDNKVISIQNAVDIFDLIVTSAWKSGDPGLIFLDAINRKNPTPQLGAIESTNPCGEVPLLPYESCNLGSLNLASMVTRGELDFDKLGRVVRIAVHFLDNVIDANHYILPEIEGMTKSNRKIGLGVMGFADCLIKLDIPYDSEQALAFADRVMGYIQREAHSESQRLGVSRGSFPNIEGSIFRDTGPMRNATVTAIAPTGTISTIAGVSSGIEPLFSVGYLRSALDTTMLVVNPLFEKIAKDRGFYSSLLLSRITRTGSIRNIKDVPDDVRWLFPVAHDIAPEFHVRMQAVFQKHVDNAVSKTINLPEHATLNDMRSVFLLAHQLGCKGITVYRYGSKRRQALTLGDIEPYETCTTGVCNF